MKTAFKIPKTIFLKNRFQSEKLLKHHPCVYLTHSAKIEKYIIVLFLIQLMPEGPPLHVFSVCFECASFRSMLHHLFPVLVYSTFMLASQRHTLAWHGYCSILDQFQMYIFFFFFLGMGEYIYRNSAVCSNIFLETAYDCFGKTVFSC